MFFFIGALLRRKQFGFKVKKKHDFHRDSNHFFLEMTNPCASYSDSRSYEYEFFAGLVLGCYMSFPIFAHKYDNRCEIFLTF